MVNKKKVITDSLNRYYIYIHAYNVMMKESIARSIDRCRDYLRNGGEVTKEWIYENNSILLPALEEYKKAMKSALEDEAFSKGVSMWDIIPEEYEFVSSTIYSINQFNRIPREPV